MRRLLWVLLAGALAFGVVQWRAQGRSVWAKIAPGLEMRTWRASLKGGGVQVIALRTSPSHVHIATGARLGATQWRNREAALLAVNGGFFDADGFSLGLRIAKGRRISRLHSNKWGVFFVSDGAAHIVPTPDFQMQPDIREAVQCGPRLVVNGKITNLKSQWARRTGIGIQRDGRVIIAIADGEMSFQDWANLWASRSGLNCLNALNLDGGSSTQLSLNTPQSSLEIPGGRLVPDAVVIR